MSGEAVVQRSIELNQPVIFAAMNHRINGRIFMLYASHLLISITVFGFLGGKEVKEAGVGNLGLHDRESTRRPQ